MAAAGRKGGKTRIERLIEKEGTIILPGVYDAISAAILQHTGFSAGFISGYSVSAAQLGLPDIGLLTPPEMADVARVVCKSAPLIPFIADADTGGGNALNVQRTIKDLINAGAAGCFLEDQAWPKKCGHMRGKQVIPAEEHAIKIAAARDAIGDADFFLIARTDARATLPGQAGLDEAIYRANLYMDAGADACFVEAPRNDDEMREIAARTRGYCVCNMIEGGKTPLKTPKELNDLGFHIMINSVTALYSSARALIDTLKILKEEGTCRNHLHRLTTFEEFNGLLGLEGYFEKEKLFAEFIRQQATVTAPPKLEMAEEAAVNGNGHAAVLEANGHAVHDVNGHGVVAFVGAAPSA